MGVLLCAPTQRLAIGDSDLSSSPAVYIVSVLTIAAPVSVLRGAVSDSSPPYPTGSPGGDYNAARVPVCCYQSSSASSRCHGNLLQCGTPRSGPVSFTVALQCWTPESGQGAAKYYPWRSYL